MRARHTAERSRCFPMIQCFASPDFESCFAAGKLPRLLSASKVDSSYSVHPRILHKHPNTLELLYVRSGSGVYILDERRYNISANDIIICNAGVLHDEDPSQSKELSTYSIALTDVSISGLPDNWLIAEAYSPVFSTGEYADTICHLMGTIHRDLQLSGGCCAVRAAAGHPQILRKRGQYCAQPHRYYRGTGQKLYRYPF